MFYKNVIDNHKILLDNGNMGLFLSSFMNRIDAKGRISVPAAFRAAVSGESFAGVVLYRSFTGKCIEGMPMSRMEALADAADKGDIFDSKLDELTAMLFADARQLPFDVTGRICIPSDLLAHAEIAAEAVFVGRGKSFQIWDPSAFQAVQAASLSRLQAEKPSFVIAAR
ncbi:MAG: division/cell wall cluster transcriptional repressor MraZ [Rickettsiales bacterium]|jgi:MraZ protein|nr:division/cell wall cluster transcriptional repressor MraZ [Rickettsiales bacterium]